MAALPLTFGLATQAVAQEAPAFVQCLWKDATTGKIGSGSERAVLDAKKGQPDNGILYADIIHDSRPEIFKISQGGWEEWSYGDAKWYPRHCIIQSGLSEGDPPWHPHCSIEITNFSYKYTAEGKVGFLGRETKVLLIDRQSGAASFDTHGFTPEGKEDPQSASDEDIHLTGTCKKTADPASLLPKPAL